MGLPVARLNDPTAFGGMIVDVQDYTVNSNNMPVAELGDIARTRVGDDWVFLPIVSGSGMVFSRNRNLSREEDIISNGDIIVNGSYNVYAGG